MKANLDYLNQCEKKGENMKKNEITKKHTNLMKKKNYVKKIYLRNKSF